MKEIKVPDNYTYIAAFLTFACNYRCEYCINRFESFYFAQSRNVTLLGKDWVKALNKLKTDLPVTLEGGEPTLHKDFYYIINNLKEELDIHILTNLNFDITEFINKIDPVRLDGKSNYATIRATYHPTEIDADDFLRHAKVLKDVGFDIGLYGILHPELEPLIFRCKDKADKMGLDFKVKDYLGFYLGKLWGKYEHKDACLMEKKRKVNCRTSELLIAPNGEVYRCHHDLYKGCSELGNITDEGFRIYDVMRGCSNYGYCNPCDVALKTFKNDEVEQERKPAVEIKL